MLKKVLVCAFAVVFVGATSAPTYADTVDVTASVPAPLPSSLPQVTGPANNTEQSNSLVFVSGTCEVVVPVLTVVLFREGEIVGSGPCLPNGTFRILVGLVLGRNVFFPKFVTITGGSGSFGAPLTLFYAPNTAPAPGSSAPQPSVTGKGLKLILDYNFVTYNNETPVELDYTIEGGTPPYSVVVNWGDNTQVNSEVLQPGTQKIRHSYGTILPPTALTVQVTDAAGEKVTQSRALVSFRKGVYIPAAQPVQKNESWLPVWYVGAVSFAGVLLLQRYKHAALAKHTTVRKQAVTTRRKKK